MESGLCIPGDQMRFSGVSLGLDSWSTSRSVLLSHVFFGGLPMSVNIDTCSKKYQCGPQFFMYSTSSSTLVYSNTESPDEELYHSIVFSLSFTSNKVSWLLVS